MITDKVIERVVNKFITRSNVGIKKYGKPLDKNLGENFLQHLQEELMDAVNYIETIQYKTERIEDLVKSESNDAELGKRLRQLLND